MATTLTCCRSLNVRDRGRKIRAKLREMGVIRANVAHCVGNTVGSEIDDENKTRLNDDLLGLAIGDRR